MKDVAILTEKRYLVSKSNDWYIQNIIKEDGLVQQELEKLNITCERKAWDDDFNPLSFKFALFRTTWNYFDELARFMGFLKNCKNSIALINPYDQIVWNLNKRYLLALEKLGINIPQTYIAAKNCKKTLRKIVEHQDWKEIVIKPCVSAAGWNTHYVKCPNSYEAEKLFSDLNKTCDVIVQCFQQNIIQKGEMSFMVIDGKYSHAVLKKAKAGDFRVQDDFGGSVIPYGPTKKEITFVQHVIQSIPFNPIYARVDVIVDNFNKLAVSELELIEPEMWFRFHDKAAHRLAQAIKRRFLMA